MISMYQMEREWQEVFKLLLDPEVPEEAVFDTLEMIEADMDTKADRYAMVMREMDGDVAAIEGEIKRLQDRKTFITNRKKALKKRLYDTMKATGRTKFKTALFSFSIQKNGGTQPVKLLGEVPEAWRKPGDPDMAKIREYLANGNDLPFAALEERGESLMIR